MDLSFLTIFGAGALTFFTPCVFPLVPIYLATLLGGDLKNVVTAGRGQLLTRSALFSVGFIGVFTLLGMGASSIGAALTTHRGVVQGMGGVMILLFGLKFLGLIRMSFLDRVFKVNGIGLTTRYGGVNALVMGVVFATGWSPCVGPILGSVLTYTAASTSSPALGALYLAVYGTGFALPLLLAAGFAEAGVDLVRRLSPYLPRIEKAVGLLLLVIAGSLFLSAVQEMDSMSKDEATSIARQEKEHQNPAMPMLLELYSTDCVVCDKMQPIMQRIETECDKRGLRVKTLDVTAPENRHLIDAFRVVGVPTFVFLDEDGEEVFRLVGEQREETLKQSIAMIRGTPCPDVAALTPSMGGGSLRPDVAAPFVEPHRVGQGSTCQL